MRISFDLNEELHEMILRHIAGELGVNTYCRDLALGVIRERK